MEVYPTEIVKRLLPNVKRPESIVRTYEYEDDKPTSSGSFMCDIPYSSVTTWTHFKPIWYGDAKVQYSIVFDNRVKNVEYDLPISCHLESNKWHAFPWPLLGIQFEKDSGFAIKVDYPVKVKNSFMQVIVLGYENLFPLSYDMYYLVDTYNKPWFKIHMPAGKYEFVFEPIQNILEEEMTYDFEDSEKLKMISDYEKPDEPVESSINNDLYNLTYRLDR